MRFASVRRLRYRFMQGTSQFLNNLVKVLPRLKTELGRELELRLDTIITTKDEMITGKIYSAIF